MILKDSFDLSQFTVSQTAIRKGIDNLPTKDEVTNLRRLHKNVLVPIKEKTGAQIIVTSGFRSEALNRAIGGAKSSQHVKGQAADIIATNMTPLELYERIKSAGIIFDQLIEEFGQWVHVSLSTTPRGQKLRAKKINGATVYLPDAS